MEVLILSKTKYGNTQVCVGGLCINDKRFVRLLNPGGYYQPSDTEFKIGDVWDITFTPVTYKREPHNEDVTISNHRFIKKIYPLSTYIQGTGVSIWRGTVLNLYDGKLRWTSNGKGYLSVHSNNLPSHSVGFWISDTDLVLQDKEYVYIKNGVTKRIVYKGSQNPLNVIPAGKLIRVSLAKWWKPDDSPIEERCYLQLSGWYENEQEPVTIRRPPTATYSTTIPSLQISRSQTASSSTSYGQSSTNKSTNQSKPQNETKDNDSSACYIATLCYGSLYSKEVSTFRDFRDNTLMNARIGRSFIANYYKFAPSIVGKLRHYPLINKAIREVVLTPILSLIVFFDLHKSKDEK